MNQTTPLVSIIVPVYNMGASIEVCVQSLMQQDYSAIEIILVDDGSTDDSLQRCQSIAERCPNVTVVHTENRGSGPARNTGIQTAKGRYAYFPDADDVLASTAISTMIAAIQSEPECDLVVFGFKAVNKNNEVLYTCRYGREIKSGEELRSSYSECMNRSNRYGIQGAPWNKFFDLNVVKNHKIAYPPLRRHQDEGFIARYMCVAKRVLFIEDVLYTYYVNDLKKEWDKYPVDYIDAVIGLYDTRKQTILTWNLQDTKTHDIVHREYICNVIKSLELSFSHKMNLSRYGRVQWIRNALKKSSIASFPVPKSLGWYQKCVLMAARHNILCLYFILSFKVAVQKIGIIR